MATFCVVGLLLLRLTVTVERHRIQYSAGTLYWMNVYRTIVCTAPWYGVEVRPTAVNLCATRSSAVADVLSANSGDALVAVQQDSQRTWPILSTPAQHRHRCRAADGAVDSGLRALHVLQTPPSYASVLSCTAVTHRFTGNKQATHVNICVH